MVPVAGFFPLYLQLWSTSVSISSVSRLLPTRLRDGSSVFTASGLSAVSPPLSAVGLTDAREIVRLDFDTRYRWAAVVLGSPR